MEQTTQTQYDYDEIDLMDIIRILKQSWKLIALIFLVTVLIVGSVTYFYLPKNYLSYTVFAVEAEGSYSAAFGKVAMVKDVVLSSSFLRDAWGQKETTTSLEDVERLRDSISIQETEAKNVKMQVIWDDPELARDILKLIFNRYMLEVDHRIGVYTENKLNVVQERYNRNKAVFDQVNIALSDFQNKHQIFFLPPQITVLDQYYQEFKAQLANSPQVLTTYEELLAEQQAAKTNYIKAYNGLEDTKHSVEKERNYLFAAIEPPFYPEKKHSPSTVMNTAVAGMLALFVGIMLAFLKEYVRNYKEKGSSTNPLSPPPQPPAGY